MKTAELFIAESGIPKDYTLYWNRGNSILLTTVMNEFADQQTASLRAENEKLRAAFGELLQILLDAQAPFYEDRREQALADLKKEWLTKAGITK